MDTVVDKDVAAGAKITYRHIFVVITGIMLTFGCSALGFSTWGLFQPLVAEALQVQTTDFALYVTVMYLTMTVFSPIAGKLLQTMDVRIVLSVAACFVGAAFFLQSLATNIAIFYVAGAVLGVGEIFILWLAIPTLINNWFAKRQGILIGICMAFTGIGGAVWSAVFTAMTSSGASFQEMYRLWAVIALVTSLPFTIFFVRSRPADVGLLPYGATSSGGDNAVLRGMPVKAVMGKPAFYVLCLFAGIINFAVLIAMQFPTYTKQLEGVPFDVLIVGGIMSSVMMVGQAIGKVTIGTVADKNTRTALVFAVSCGAIGTLLCWLGYQQTSMLYSGAFIFGFFYATSLVLVPIITRQLFGSREYSLVYSRVSTAFNLIAAFSSVTWAYIGQTWGFSVVFIVGLVLIAVVSILGLYLLKQTKVLSKSWS